MSGYHAASELENAVERFVLAVDTPQRMIPVPSNPTWRRLGELGTELWLDTGDMDEVESLWTEEFSRLTTNNTLLNKEVQTGQYDELIARAAELLDEFDLDASGWKLEMAFILNAVHARKLVARFDAFVSVEEHTDLAGDVEATVAYARRYYAICPERFIVKIPLTPAGVIATRRLAGEVPVNHTLGFSARQNYLIARLGRPKFVNVFLGRLNSLAADNGLGDGTYVGERATLASQAAVAALRDERRTDTRQIAASLRGGEQVRDLAGVDVMTMPPKVARQFLEMDLPPEEVTDRTGEDYRPPLADGVAPEAVRLSTLWEVPGEVRRAVDELDTRALTDMDPGDLVAALSGRGVADLLVEFSDEEVAASRRDGKIPRLDHWREQLAAGRVGLDTLMNLAGLNAFASDQDAMDERVAAAMQTV